MSSKNKTFWFEKDKAWEGELFKNMILTSKDEEEFRIQKLRQEFFFAHKENLEKYPYIELN